MALPTNLKFDCSVLESINQHKIKALKPDSNGCYEVVLGAVGVPTRRNVIYDPDSLVAAMRDPNAVFNICLRDGQLCGEYGHPDLPTVTDKQSMSEMTKRLFTIKESETSHSFARIWIDENEIPMNGGVAHPIRALVKPTGPYGRLLEEQLRDPIVNSAFSIRSLCTPTVGHDGVEVRKVQAVVTFDFVNAPGYEIASKRYCNGSESLYDIDYSTLNTVASAAASLGTESLMISPAQIANLRFNDAKSYRMAGVEGVHLSGLTLYGSDGVGHDLTSLMLRRRG